MNLSKHKISHTILGLTIIFGTVGYLSLPHFFNHIIKIEIANIIEDSFNGKVNYKKIKVSSFNDLPYLSISLDSVTLMDLVRNKPDTLFFVEKLSFSISLNDWLFAHKYVVKKISMNSPRIWAKKYRNGVDNFSYLFTEDTASLKSDTSKFNFKINYFSIKDGYLCYKDFGSKTLAIAEKLNLKGTIDISNLAENLKIFFETDDVVLKYNGITYLYKNTILADLILDFNTVLKSITFKDHLIQIDHFKFGLKGFLRQQSDTLNIDLKFITKDAEIKNLMSLIPGIYKKDYAKFDAKGTFSLNGELKGLINAKHELTPSYFAHFILKNGRFKYNHLPKPITNINLDMRYEKLNTKSDPIFTVNKFYAKLDSNFVAGVLTVVGTSNPFMVGNLNAVLELHELGKFLKLDSFKLAGNVVANLAINGVYNHELSSFPKMKGKVVLQKGYFKRIDVVHALQNIEMETTLQNETGFIENTSLKLSKLNLKIDGEYLEMYGKMEDFKKYNFDLFLRSNIDLSKLSKIIKIENQTLTGFVNTRIIAKGSAAKFKEAYISGTAAFKDVKLINPEANIDIKIRQGNVVFSPELILLSKFDAFVFDENYIINGTLRNFIPYFLHENGVLQSNFRINADSMNINKYFESSNRSINAKPDSTLKISEINAKEKSFEGLKNIDLELKLNVKRFKYDKYTFQKLNTTIKANAKSIDLEKTNFSVADAAIAISMASFTPKNFTMTLDIKTLDTRKLLKLLFNTSKDSLVSQNETGAIVDINYKLKGDLDASFNPILYSLNGNGLISVDKANIKGLKVLSHISKATEQKDLHHQEIHDAEIETEIKGGKVHIKPFTVKLGKYLTNFEGTHAFNNEINYFIKLGIPPFQKIKIPVHVTGTIDKPEVNIAKKKTE